MTGANTAFHSTDSPRSDLRPLSAGETRHIAGGDGNDPLPVLMVVADQQDFYYREYGDTRANIGLPGSLKR